MGSHDFAIVTTHTVDDGNYLVVSFFNETASTKKKSEHAVPTNDCGMWNLKPTTSCISISSEYHVTGKCNKTIIQKVNPLMR